LVVGLILLQQDHFIDHRWSSGLFFCSKIIFPVSGSVFEERLKIPRSIRRIQMSDITRVGVEHQRCRGIYDDEAKAESYQTVSSSCALWARKVALRDQRDAEDYLDE
jgi:hypothetical protein